MCDIQNESSEYTYEFILEKSQKLNRLKYKLPNDAIKRFSNIKQKLNIKESSTFKRPVCLDKTQIQKQKVELGELYKILNKITDKTYDKLSNDIFNHIEQINDIESQKEICAKIFHIISSNSFYSKIYARLYAEMINIHSTFKDAFIEQREIYMTSISDIEFVSPNENYDDYCMYVKKLDTIISMSTFFINCMKENIISCDDMVSIILFFQQKMIDNYDYETKITENEAYINNIFHILKECIDLLCLHGEWDFIVRNNLYLHQTSGAGKNNKIKFKIMDINDLLKKNNL